MKLLLETAMVFFGTLLAAGLVALGQPAQADLDILQVQVSEPARNLPGR